MLKIRRFVNIMVLYNLTNITIWESRVFLEKIVTVEKSNMADPLVSVLI